MDVGDAFICIARRESAMAARASGVRRPAPVTQPPLPPRYREALSGSGVLSNAAALARKPRPPMGALPGRLVPRTLFTAFVPPPLSVDATPFPAATPCRVLCWFSSLFTKHAVSQIARTIRK
jgi:hypothetical protein